MRRWLAALLLSVTATAHAQAAPRITAILFEGNDTTRSVTLLREVSVRPGEPAEPDAIEKSRQAIQDLGLFRSVKAELRPDGDGVQAVFIVDEKFYFIPAPRADTNTDGQYAYGVQLRWYNVLGYNHTAKFVLKKTNRQEKDRGTALEFDGSYYAPFIFDTSYGLDLSYSHNREPVIAPATYDVVSENVRTVVFRNFQSSTAPPSQGWRLGTGVQWHSSMNDGQPAPPSDGRATALVLNASYVNRRFNIYSERGYSWNLEWQGATTHALSDYDTSTVTGRYDASWYFGDTPHQSCGVFAEGGVHDGGPASEVDAFGIGGASDLRGYPHNFVRGDSYYYGGIEALRPLHWDWLRGVIFFESGNAYPDGESFALENSYADVGIGVRLRVPLFVKFELNIGYAYPVRKLAGGGSGRIFATGRR